ncbi:MAG: hypothetical protein LBG27_10140 [Spirochaetaceae bacterium]|jgi:hypothetical protein|nr:hypothetical protein [Spirochaetaceae bacterium]
MTIRQIADITGAAYSTVAAYAQKAGWTKNGKATLLDDRQTTIIVEAMKQANSNQHDLPRSLEGTETALTPALKLEMLYRQIDEIKTAEIARLKSENTRLQIKADEHETYLTVKRVAKLNHIRWSSLDWKRVMRSSQALELEWQKADDINYGKCNAYHIEAWRDAYPALEYERASV